MPIDSDINNLNIVIFSIYDLGSEKKLKAVFLLMDFKFGYYKFVRMYKDNLLISIDCYPVVDIAFSVPNLRIIF